MRFRALLCLLFFVSIAEAQDDHWTVDSQTAGDSQNGGDQSADEKSSEPKEKALPSGAILKWCQEGTKKV